MIFKFSRKVLKDKKKNNKPGEKRLYLLNAIK